VIAAALPAFALAAANAQGQPPGVKRLGLLLTPVEGGFRRRNVRAVINLWGPDPVVIDAARRQRVGLIDLSVAAVENGALAAVEGDSSQDAARIAAMAAKVLKGAHVANIPFERPTRFRLVLNARTGAALGVAFPTSVRLRAERVIE
jgi:hypothetical protein